MHHNFIYLYKGVYMVCTGAAWLVMKKHNIGVKLVKYNLNHLTTKASEHSWLIIAHLYVSNDSQSSPEFLISLQYNDFLENYAWEGWHCRNRRAAWLVGTELDLIARSKHEVADLTKRLNLRTRRYGMGICSEKSKNTVTIKSSQESNTTLYTILDGQTLDKVKHFQYIGTT